MRRHASVHTWPAMTGFADKDFERLQHFILILCSFRGPIKMRDTER